MRWVLLLAVVMASCTDTDASETPLTLGDTAFYETDVQDYVGYRCGSLDCHGDMGRSLRIYAKDGLRKSDALRRQPMSLEEIDDNVAALSVFSRFDAVDQSFSLTKALSVGSGGMAHEGDPVWQDRNDEGYLCLAGWLAGTSPASACANALALVEPEP